MTKNEFIKRHNSIKDPIAEKYGAFLWFLMSDILNIGHIEKVVESMRYTTVRKSFPNTYTPYSELYSGGKLIGSIDIQGFPSIMLHKRNKKHAVVIAKHEDVIEGIEGVHRILDWHEKDRKFHKLAGGQIVLHFLPLAISLEDAEKFLVDTKLIDSVDHFKKQEAKTLSHETILYV